MDTAATGNASLTKMSTASVKQIRPCELLPLEVNAIPTRITYRIPSKVRANRQQGFRPSYARRRTDWIQHLDLVHRVLNPLMQ